MDRARQPDEPIPKRQIDANLEFLILSIQLLFLYICIRGRQEGNIWCGTSDNGVLKFNPHTHSFTRINYAQNLDVHALCENAQGKMWVGTEAGIFSVENDKINKEQELNRQMGKIQPSSTLSKKIIMAKYGLAP